MSAPLPEITSPTNPPLYRDARVLKVGGQLIVLAIVIAVVAYLVNNLLTNYDDRNLPTGFAWLSGRFGQAIPGLEDVSGAFNLREAFFAAFLNTVRVIAVGIPACTIIGIGIGIARLSENAAARTFGTVYVETFRNIPPLVWVFIFHFAISLGYFPRIENAPAANGFVVSNRGVGIPWLNPDASLAVFVGFILLGFVAAALVGRWRNRVNEKTGQPARAELYGFGTFLLLVLIGNVVAGNSLALEGSAIAESGRTINDGLTIQIDYFSLTIALTLYTASHVAEIVRGAILSVPNGQGEAADAVALSTVQRYRFVILPQAFRVMIPPLTNQYLNITKNSSLAVGIGFFEIAAWFQRVSNNSTPAVQALLVLMAGYLVFSLSISLIANYANNRLSLESR